jgi:3-hydroxyacyl-CoA dehydrogenase/enoyl-CoA hydratase/3-hydroxybutyryl-CoA epimerase
MNRHWRLETDTDGIGWLHFDHAESAVNLLSREALDELSSQLDRMEQLSLNGLVILSDKRDGFIAGADVSEFRDPGQVETVRSHIQQVHGLLQRLEDLPFPSLAMIKGFCLGGGLELALACSYRIAEAGAQTRLAFPEVRLGLFPGYGGTARSIELLGPLPALRLMLSGRGLDAGTALKIGLLDRVAPDRQLRATAVRLLEKRPPVRRAAWWRHLSNSTPARHLVTPMLVKQTAKRVNPAHYPAPFALIDHWKRCGGSRSALLVGEAESVSRLLVGETAQNLIRLFFLRERLKSLARADGVAPSHLHVVGGGIMGGDIAAWCALRGLRVSLQDRKPEYLSGAVRRAHRLFAARLRSKRLRQAAKDRLMPDPRGDGLRQADLVIEAIFEDAGAKQRLFQSIERRVGPNTLLATNTSSIPLETIGEALHDPSRLIGLHFFNPVSKMQLVEVVHGPDTPMELIQRGCTFVRAIDRLPLPVKSRPGFLVNRVLMPYLLEAVELLQEGVPAGVIDQAAVDFGMPMGPIELADRVGLDICLAVAETLAPVYQLQIPDVLRARVNNNRLGLKSGEGFYRYRHGQKIPESQSAQYHRPGDLTERMIFRLLNEAVACLREAIVEDPDLLDAGIVFGAGFAPFRGGPMHCVASGGLGNLRSRLAELERQHGEQFHADAGWAKLRGI